MVLIDIEVLDAQFDYNILFGQSYMHAMLAIVSFIFWTMMFHHKDCIITISQLTHSEKWNLTNTNVILPYVDTSTNALTQYQEYDPGLLKP